MQLILVVQSYLFEFKNDIRFRIFDTKGYMIYDDLFYFFIYLEFISESYFMYQR